MISSSTALKEATARSGGWSRDFENQTSKQSGGVLVTKWNRHKDTMLEALSAIENSVKSGEWGSDISISPACFSIARKFAEKLAYENLVKVPAIIPTMTQEIAFEWDSDEHSADGIITIDETGHLCISIIDSDNVKTAQESKFKGEMYSAVQNAIAMLRKK